jgi:hypothetical protein
MEIGLKRCSGGSRATPVVATVEEKILVVALQLNAVREVPGTHVTRHQL